MTDTKRSLEGYRVFPYIAWATIFLFTIFVYYLAVELRVAAEHLHSATARLEAAVNTPLDTTTDSDVRAE